MRASGCRSLIEPDGRVQARQVAQAEEVHLQQAGLLDVAHLPLGADDLLVLVLVRELLERDQVLERPVGDHHARGVRADVPDRPFEPSGEVEQLARSRGLPRSAACSAGSSLSASSSVMFSRVGISLVTWSTRASGMFSARPTSLSAALAAIVPNVPIWATLAVAVLLADVLDDLVPPLLAEVDVDVGRLGPVRVEEPLEQQVVLERADVAQVEQVADQRPAGRAPGRAGDARLAGEADEVPDDQEVRGEPHPVDDAQLVLEPLDAASAAGSSP